MTYRPINYSPAEATLGLVGDVRFDAFNGKPVRAGTTAGLEEARRANHARGPLRQRNAQKPRPCRLPNAAGGSALALIGAYWLLTILGFEVPWFAFIPMLFMLIGGFIIVTALNYNISTA